MKIQPYIFLAFLLSIGVAVAQHKPKWEVNSLNTGIGFAGLQTLSDGSVLSRLVHSSPRNSLPSAFYDSQNNKIPYFDWGYEKKYSGLIKFNNEGIFRWSNFYTNQSYDYDPEIEFDFIGYKVLHDDQIMVLVKFNENYFRKIYEEEAFQREIQFDDEEEYDEIDNAENEEFNDGVPPDRSLYGLQFLDTNTGNVKSTMLISELNAHNTEIYNIETLGDNTIILAGRTFTPHLRNTFLASVEEKNQPFGHFVAAINPNTGKILWHDFISFAPREGFYFHETRNNSHLSVSDDGTIYFSSQHYGDVSFSNQEHIRSNSIEKNAIQEQTYVVSYSKEGKINWVKSNRNISHPQAMASDNTGVYVAQISNGNHSFDLQTDTINLKPVSLSFINKEGVESWVVNFPVSKINSIHLDPENLVVQGVYNYFYPGRKTYQINDTISLNEKNDFFIIKMTKSGTVSTVHTERLWLQDHLHSIETSFKLGDNGYAYLSYHTKKYFTEEERERKGIRMDSQNAFAGLFRIVKIKLDSLKFD